MLLDALPYLFILPSTRAAADSYHYSGQLSRCFVPDAKISTFKCSPKRPTLIAGFARPQFANLLEKDALFAVSCCTMPTSTRRNDPISLIPLYHS